MGGRHSTPSCPGLCGSASGVIGAVARFARLGPIQADKVSFFFFSHRVCVAIGMANDKGCRTRHFLDLILVILDRAGRETPLPFWHVLRVLGFLSLPGQGCCGMIILACYERYSQATKPSDDQAKTLRAKSKRYGCPATPLGKKTRASKGEGSGYKIQNVSQLKLVYDRVLNLTTYTTFLNAFISADLKGKTKKPENFTRLAAAPAS